MAIVNGNVGKIDLSGGSALPAFVGISAEGMTILWNKGDHRMLLLVKNSGSTAATLTIKKGNSIQAVADLVVSVPAGETWGFTPESGKYKHISGDMRGNILLNASATTLQAAAVYSN